MSPTNNTEEDLKFKYADSDSYDNEIGEIYSYTEEDDFEVYRENYNEFMSENYGFSKKWGELEQNEKENTLLILMNQVDDASKDKRSRVMSCLLYLAQGVFGEAENIDEQRSVSCQNCFLLYKFGAFALAQDLLLVNINNPTENPSPSSKKMLLSSINDNRELRELFSFMCTIVETIWRNDNPDNVEQQEIRTEFIHSLDQPIDNGDPLSIVLFNMVMKFCSHSNTKYPIKKVLLLLWKILLITLGGIKSQYLEKCKLREINNLPAIPEDPLKIMEEMHASAPPTNSADLLEIAVSRRKGKTTFEAAIDTEPAKDDLDIHMPNTDEEIADADNDEESEEADGEAEDVSDSIDGDAVPAAPATPMPFSIPTEATNIAATAAKLVEIKNAVAAEEHPAVKVPIGLPWTPKARAKDLEDFIDQVRIKFIGYKIEGDNNTVAGLPPPIQDSLAVLKRHVYVSLSDLQTERETLITNYPLTKGKNEVVNDTPTERLYQAMLGNLPQYMIALLKILLAAAPTSRAKTDPINILADVLPAEMPSSVVQSMKLGIDVNRHREIIVKSVSAILLLLLKGFKLNHIYQFEYVSQHLVFANCIPLILKFFNQNISAYVMTMNVIPMKEFPACVIGKKIELTEESLEALDSVEKVCWRNLFSSINLLRVLNKLVKWKHSRTMMLVVFKSAPILKRALKVRQAMMQVYVLKLLKLQTKYLGRAWRKSNMKIMSAIYQKVRHRLSDDWAFGNDVDARPWDFQQEECTLRASVEKFNFRRYKSSSLSSVQINSEQLPVDNNLHSVLARKVELPLEFTKSYDVWLEREVYSNSVKWEELLSVPYVE